VPTGSGHGDKKQKREGTKERSHLQAGTRRETNIRMKSPLKNRITED